MKESKKRDGLSSKKKRHGKGSSINLESWDQTDLEDADEKVLEKRLLQLRMQLEIEHDEVAREKRLPNKYKKKYTSEDLASSDSESSNSDSSLSSTSSISVRKYKSKKSSSISDDSRKKYSRSPVTKKKFSKNLKNSRNAGRAEREKTINPKADKKIVFRKKVSPVSDKYSRKKSPSLDRREIYSRVDTGRWHEKAKEFTKERNKREVEQEKTRARSRSARNRSSSPVRESRRASRSKEGRIQKKLVGRGTTTTAARRKDSPEPSRARGSYDSVRRTTLVTRKSSPRDERTGRHDERRPDLKLTRRNDIRPDARDVNVRTTRDVRDRKELLTKMPEKAREREIVGKAHREVLEHSSVDRDRSRVSDDRLKERDKRLQDRIEPDRNSRNLSHGSRDSADDKFRRNDRTTELNRGGGVFDRMRNRYNDRRNAENNQRLVRDKPMLDIKKDRAVEKEPIKPRSIDMNGADKTIRDRRQIVPQLRGRSPIHRDRKESERNAMEKRSRSPVNFDRRFSSPLNSRKARESENRILVKRKSQENDDPRWSKKKPLNEVRSRSRSSERRRKSSQEEWRVIDMTSPVLDDEFSDENNGTFESNVQSKLKRPVSSKVTHVVKSDDTILDRNKPMLTDELSDISDEDFGDVNANNSIKIKRDVLPKHDKLIKSDQINRNYDQKSSNMRQGVGDNKVATIETKNTTNFVDDLIGDQKLENTEAERVDFEKDGDDLDSEEDTVSRVSDALGVDWTDLVEESKKQAPHLANASYSIRRRWSVSSIFARIGVSEKYAGEELYYEIKNEITSWQDDSACETRTEDEKEKLWHKEANLHVCLRDKSIRRQNLFEPYKTAISARKDIVLRRRLCGLPVKNLHTQQIIGICHWIV